MSATTRTWRTSEFFLYGDQAYWSEMHRAAARERGVRYRVNRRPHAGRPLTLYQRQLNRLRSATRARGEHAFHVVKRLWGFTKVRYRGPRTPRGCSPPSHWRTYIWSDVVCWPRSGSVDANREC